MTAAPPEDQKLVDNQAAVGTTDRHFLAVAIDAEGNVSFHDTHGATPQNILRLNLKTGLKGALYIVSAISYGHLAIVDKNESIHAYQWKNGKGQSVHIDSAGCWVKEDVSADLQVRSTGVHYVGIRPLNNGYEIVLEPSEVHLGKCEKTIAMRRQYAAPWYAIFDWSTHWAQDFRVRD
jgi:hypothetical protein